MLFYGDDLFDDGDDQCGGAPHAGPQAPRAEPDSEFDSMMHALVRDVVSTNATECRLDGKPPVVSVPEVVKLKRSMEDDRADAALQGRDVRILVADVSRECKRCRLKAHAPPADRTSDRELSCRARFTDKFNLKPYTHFIHYVPRLVNTVTLAEAIPAEGSGIRLPLDLARIASLCRNSYFAPGKFSAVQLAYANPRSRVLVFHTGRMVGTGEAAAAARASKPARLQARARPIAPPPTRGAFAGTPGPVAARLSLLRAQRQLLQDAGIPINLRNFSVINSVGALNLKATLNCSAFADAHTAEAHYDVKSFIGLAWRPPGECICCEIYSTGRAK